MKRLLLVLGLVAAPLVASAPVVSAGGTSPSAVPTASFQSVCVGSDWQIVNDGAQSLRVAAAAGTVPGGLLPGGQSLSVPADVDNVTIIGDFDQFVGAPARPACAADPTTTEPTTTTAAADPTTTEPTTTSASADPTTTEPTTTTTEPPMTTSSTTATSVAPATTSAPATTTASSTTPAPSTTARPTTTTMRPTTTTAPVVPPSSPRFVTATPGNRTIMLHWAAPATLGSAPVTYTVRRQAPGGAWITLNTSLAGLTYSSNGLTNGVTYVFTVSAHSAAGQSAAAPSVRNAPRTVPTAPRTLVTAVAPATGSGQVRLSWLAPTTNGGAAVTDYVIQRANGASGWVAINDGVRTSTSYTVTGLANGARYSFRVLARNAAGLGSPSSIASQVPRTAPGGARIFRASPGSGRATLTWSAPASTGGAAITRYAIQRSTSPTSGWVYLSTSVPANVRSFSAMNLRNGTRYYFRIVAMNAAGMGPWTAAVGATPAASPTRPPVPPAPPTRRCDPSYPTLCIPPGAPDLDCGDITAHDFLVLPPDPHGFDRDHDRMGCES